MSLTKQISKTRLFTVIDILEDELSARKDVIHSTSGSPIRFEIMKERLKSKEGGAPIHMLPTMLQCLSGIKESLRTLEENPPVPKTRASDEIFQELKEYALDLGASSIGYTRLPSRWVFKDKAVVYDNALVLSMEMDKEGIDSAPSLACMKTVMLTYRDLGRITNKIAALLRSYGYGAHAGHPLMGVALYPPLAQMAGLGWMGLNGIIITPEHGPRVRLAAVFTSIENLPFSSQNDHGWVADYCETCKICINKCPPKALYGRPVDHGNGQFTYVKNELCFPYFNKYHGCSVCVAVCPFNHIPYQKIKVGFEGK
ncbi:MAG: reductive dehalogenase domain-containing protein [Anaerolineales bacterium]